MKILDTLPEERFDRITRLARQMFHVPIALVSLIDKERQWFKSNFGLTASETSRDVSFCGHTILDHRPLVINDAFADPRFANNPLVLSDPNIRFYAGVPLIYSNRLKLGTLCIIDDKPRSFSDEETQQLVQLAKMAEQELCTSFTNTIDELTHLSNRAGFNCLVEKALNFCHFGRYPFSLVYVHTTKVKNISVQTEHDYALTQFASLLRNMFRSSDLLARVGPESFVIFMVGTTERVSLTAIKRFKNAITNYNKDCTREYDLSFDFGLACGTYHSNFTVDKLIDEAYNKMCIKQTNTH
nr:GAF domain-containing protein [Vibrio sinus]